jgi:ribosomal protein S18 acetylase RimI-like enzyme
VPVTPAARKATHADIEALSESIARAFDDDPVWIYLFPERRRHERARAFVAYELQHHYLRQDETWTVDGLGGAAAWMPPKTWRQTNLDTVRSLPTMLRLIGTRLPTAARAMAAIEDAHPPGDHYYLSILGTDPAHQGKGVASACLGPVLARCDAQGLGAYLESSKETNIPFYNRHGFEVTRVLPLPNGGPSLWLMWREPRN